MTPAEFDAYLRKDIEKWAEVVKAVRGEGATDGWSCRCHLRWEIVAFAALAVTVTQPWCRAAAAWRLPSSCGSPSPS